MMTGLQQCRVQERTRLKNSRPTDEQIVSCPFPLEI